MGNPNPARRPSTIVNRTVTPRRPPNADLREREYLTPKEVDRLQEAARKHSRYGHRDATAILIAYRNAPAHRQGNPGTAPAAAGEPAKPLRLQHRTRWAGD